MLYNVMKVKTIGLVFLVFFPTINCSVILKIVSVALPTFKIKDYITRLYDGFTN